MILHYCFVQCMYLYWSPCNHFHPSAYCQASCLSVCSYLFVYTLASGADALPLKYYVTKLEFNEWAITVLVFFFWITVELEWSFSSLNAIRLPIHRKPAKIHWVILAALHTPYTIISFTQHMGSTVVGKWLTFNPHLGSARQLIPCCG